MAGWLAVLNAGSSSIKFAIHSAAHDGPAHMRGQIEGIGLQPTLTVHGMEGDILVRRQWGADGFDHAMATKELLQVITQLLAGEKVSAVGHRVVHGGMVHAAPVKVDAALLDELAALTPLAPLHQPHNLAPIRTIAAHAPHLPQVICFDTAFHRSQDRQAQSFGLPSSFYDEGIRRYGFHGLSYEYVSGRLRDVAPEIASGRVVIGHLGNGASLCAIRNGRSIASTMGFTAVDGLVMGTRCGALDPGVLLYLADERGMDTKAIEDLIYRRSGLLGVSGISSDMRTLRASDAPGAALAIGLFVYRIVREIGSLAAALGGLDGLVFTGGIGENDAASRAEVMRGCSWLGLEFDDEQNKAGGQRVSAAGSRVQALVVPTDEERMIARHTAAVLEQSR